MSLNIKNSSIFIFIIVCLLIGSSLGIYNILGVNIYPAKVMILFLILILLNQNIFISKEVKNILFLSGSLVFYSFITILWSQDLLISFKYSIYLLLTWLLYFLFLIFLQNHKSIYNFYKSMVYFSIIVMAISLIEIFFGFHLLNSEHNFHSLAIKSYIPTAFFQNENLLGTYIVLWVIPFLYSYLYNNNPKNLSVWLMLILYLYVLLETSSRANFLALIIGFIYIFVFLLNKKKSFFIFLIIFPFLFFAFLQLNSLLDESEYENITSVSIRLDLSIFAIKIFFDSFLLGAGAGSIELLVKNNNFDFGITNIHNYWLEILANFGIIGLLLYFVFYFVILMNIFNIKKRFINNKYVKFITDGLFISLLMFPISIISNSSVIFNPIIMIYFGFIITFINVYSKVSSKYEK